MQLGIHASPYGKFVETAQFIYLCDINGVAKKYVRTKEFTEVYGKKFASKDEWNLRSGKSGNAVGLSTCTGEYLNGNPANPIYKIHVFEPID